MGLQVKASATVLPPGTLPKIPLPEGDLVVKILAIDPENGYDDAGKPRPSEKEMVKVQYPDGFVKNHQTSDMVDLLSKVKNLLMAKYTITSFEFDKVPALEVGAEIKLIGVK